MARPNQVRGAKRPAGPRIDAAIYLAIGCALAYFAATTDLRPHFPAALPAPAATKPFATFDEFYPFYLTQHSDVTCRRLHVVGTSILTVLLLAKSPATLGAMFAALPAGFAACLLTMGVPHGIPEVIVTLVVFLGLARAWAGTVKFGLLAMAIGYGFAWAGHFFFEHNQPATFIYPSYSLMGDFRMAAEVLSGQRAF